MSWTLSTPGGKSIELIQPQSDRDVADGGVNVFDLYGFDAPEAILAGLEHQEKIEMTGIATGNRLSGMSGYSSDPLTAIAEWTVEFMSFVNGEQGTGLTINNTDRGITYQGLVTRTGWQRNAGDKYQVLWDLSLLRGEATAASQNDTSPPSVNPHDSPTFDGQDLYTIDSFREDKKEEAGIYPIALADPGGNQVLSKGGATRKVTIRGKVPGNRSTLNSFDSTMRGKVGQDLVGTLDTGFPGRGIDCMITNFEGTRESGVTSYGEYYLELIEGQSLTTGL